MNKSFYNYDSERIIDKNVDECIGICKGILSDNELNNDEKEFLINWIEKHKLNQKNEIIKILFNELKNEKNSLDNIKDVLIKFTGGILTPHNEIKSMTTSLPIEKIIESIEFKDKTFCLTGNFSSAYGNRKAIEDIIKDKGGMIKNTVPQSLNYLVIGEFGNTDWIHSSYGRKIEKAISNQKNSYCNTKIISESQLLPFLEG